MTTKKRPLYLQAIYSASLAGAAAVALLGLAGCVDDNHNYSPPRYREFYDDHGTHSRFLREHMYSPQGSQYRRSEHGRS